jgi:peroxiredoxin
MYAAMVPIRSYVVELSDLQGSGDFRAMREAAGAARGKLMEQLGKVLTEEQLEQFQEATGRRGQFDRGPRRGGPDPIQNPAPVNAEVNAAVGKAAPAFTLNDRNGQVHSRTDYAGKIVILQWINPDCPICRRVHATGLVKAMKQRLAEISSDVVHLTINSTHYMEPSVGAEYLKTNKIDAPLLIDRDGAVGHLYAAKTTPHMFVIDAKGVLRYQGAIDDDPHGRKGEEAMNYVVQAVQQIAAGETVSPDQTQAYGCTVKYAK